jgi:hypothetical protein
MTYEPTPSTLWTRVRDNINRRGSDATSIYMAPPGILAYMDFLFLPPREVLGLYAHTLQPQTVVVHTMLIEYFIEYIFPLLTKPFVLVTVMTDRTIPLNVDLRFWGDEITELPELIRTNVAYIAKGNDHTLTPNLNLGSPLVNITSSWLKMIQSRMVIHWYAENHIYKHPKVSTLPIGSQIDYENNPRFDDLPLLQRIPKIYVADKIHDGNPQWDDRRATANACIRRPDICVALHGNHSGRVKYMDEWLDSVATYQFLAITHGGGLDPCPKLFDALYVGTIPILQKNAMVLHPNYSKLFPIVYVDNLVDFLSWNNISMILKTWVKEKAPYFIKGSKLRNQTLDRMKNKYWYHKIISHIHKKKDSHLHR